MARGGGADGDDVTGPGGERPRWILVRQGPLAPEERRVLAALPRAAAAEGKEIVAVLLGSASYDAESPDPTFGPGVEEWVLEEDAVGRGIRRPADRPGRTVSYDELAEAILAAERVIQLP